MRKNFTSEIKDGGLVRIDSEGEAEKLVGSILRNTQTRQRCLEAFADAACEADRHSDGIWAVTCSKEKIRLQVGPVIICNIGDRRAGTERLWLALDRESLARAGERSTFEGSGDWEWGVGKYATYRVISTRNGCYFPSERHEKIWPEIRGLHFEAIRRAGQRGGSRQRTKDGHSPGILEHLRNTLGRSVPDPAYSG